MPMIMLLFISPKNEVDIRKECVKMNKKNVFLVIFLTVHQTEKIPKKNFNSYIVSINMIKN